MKEKEYIFGIMVIDMKVIIKMIKEKEKEYFIGIMVIDMKVNGKMIKRKEKEYFMIIMVLRKWEIFLMVIKLEFMLN